MPHNTLEKWEEKQLKDICDFHNGLWTGKKEPFIECNVIRNANFTKDFKLNYDNVVKINVEERQFQTRELEYGDLILEKSGGGPNQPVGRVVIFDKHEKGYSFSNFTSSIRIKNKDILDFRFLYLYLCYCYLLGMTTKMQKNSTGIRNLLFDDYKNIYVPIPNINEQQRIVGILDEVFENIEKARQNTLQNLNNAKELFETCADNIFTSSHKDWVDKYLNDVCTVERGSSPRPIKSFITTDGSGVNWIKIGDCSGKYVTCTAQKITEEGAKKSRYVKEGDFIISNSMSYGKPYILKIDGYIHDGWFVLRLNKNLVNTDYFYYLLSSNYIKEQYDALATGAIVQNISSDLIKKVKFELPSIQEQQKIVQQLDELQEQTKKLEQIYTQKLQDLDEFKQSILQKAFNGEL